MYLTIHAPDQLIFAGNVEKVTLPGAAGPFQVLKDHAPLVTTFQQGYVRYQADAKEHMLAVHQGLAEVLNNQVTILLESAQV
jgi:F-type H+-transporting ATPase subunit epsilon